MRVIIFLQSGKTFTFEGVSDLTTNESLISFQYQSQSAPLGRRAVFYVSQVAGVGRDGGQS